MRIIAEQPGLYKIIELKLFRKTPGVTFDLFPMKAVPHIDSIDRIIHDHNAISPGPVGDVLQPWYMHTAQQDNLIVLCGKRDVDIFTKEHGKIEHFTISSDKIYHNGSLVFEGGAVLVWPENVFHRIVSGEDGSASINLAVHTEGFDLKTNFGIYDLNTKTGEYRVIREGYEDQLLDDL